MSETKITIIDDGPLKVEGDVTLEDAEGNPVEPPRTDRFFLCRCGHSSNKPFCDGTHNEIDFEGEVVE